MDWCGIKWVIPGSLESLIQWWLRWRFRKKERQVWRAVLISVIWSLWKFKNYCVFNGTQPRIEELSELIKDIGCFYSIDVIVSNIQHVRKCI
ncbi:hypothetical protein CsSME_00032292 [Camellia sinensis var. sinensis]